MLIAALLASVIISSMAFAEEAAIRVYLGRDAGNGVFIISWANSEEPAVVELTGPNGEKIAANESNSVFETGRITMKVPDVKRGYWNVLVSGEGLGSISVTGGSLDGISSGSEDEDTSGKFSASYDNGKIEFNWNIETDEDEIGLSVYLYGANGSDRIYNDYDAPRTGTGTVDVSSYNTGIYKVRAEVYTGGKTEKIIEKDPFYIEQKNAGEKVSGIRAGSVDGEFFIIWDSYNMNNSYVVTMYDYDTMDVIDSDTVYQNRFTIPLDNAPSKFKYSVSSLEGRVAGGFDVFEYEKHIPSGAVLFPDISVTKDESIDISIAGEDGCTAAVYLDEECVNDDLTNGNYSFVLSEGEHKIVVLISDAFGNIATFEKNMTVDKTPPVISLNNNDNETTNSESIIISGSTEPNAVVTVNGVEQNSANGSFSAKIDVERGITAVTVSVYDAAGNKSVRSITVERNNSIPSFIIKAAAAAIVCIALLAWYLILNNHGKRGNREASK